MKLADILQDLKFVYKQVGESVNEPTISSFDRYRHTGRSTYRLYDGRIQLAPLDVYLLLEFDEPIPPQVRSFVNSLGDKGDLHHDDIVRVRAEYSHTANILDKSAIWTPFFEKLQEIYDVRIEKACNGIKETLTTSAGRQNSTYERKVLSIETEANVQMALLKVMQAGLQLEKAIKSEQQRILDYLS